jgi:5-methylthioadenosine/S-adenosylhomocysteine deaminase
MDANNQVQVLENHCLVIDQRKIVALLPEQEAKAKYRAKTEQHLTTHLLIPGLINAHTHAPMSLLRGIADDLPLMDWLQNHIWPAEGKWVNEAFIEEGTELAIAEMIRGGTTCFNDMYFFPDITGKVAEKAGLRATVGLIVLDFPTVWAQNADEYLVKARQVFELFKGSDLINTALAPHAPYTVSDEPLIKVNQLAEELNVQIQMHIHETEDEIHQGEAKDGVRPLTRLQGLKFLSSRLMAVHMANLEEDEITLVKTTGVNVVHCPESNMKLASGFCPLYKLTQAGVNVALGTDGAASNNDLDMLGEMRSAGFLAKGVAGQADALPAHELLAMATINGAKALGIDEVTGSLEVGKFADVVAVDFNDLETQPCYHPIPHLIYSATRSQVSDVWVAGQQLMSKRQLLTLDENEIRRKTKLWEQKISGE